MSQRLLNKVAVVTGAGRGIGRAVARTYLTEGAKVVLFGRTRSHLEETADVAPARAIVVDGDVTSADDLDRLAGTTFRRFGRIHVLVPCAGVVQRASWAETTSEMVVQQFRVNFLGTLETIRRFLPHFHQRGTIMLMTASPSLRGDPELGAFSAGKAAVRSLAESLRAELEPRSIHVNCLAPGPTATAFWEQADPITGRSRTKQRHHKLDPSQMNDPQDVADVAVFLASEAARHINGQEIAVDGGVLDR